MQCPRCYFDNPSTARLCEYCGSILADGPAPPSPGAASTKRRTQLGAAPVLPPRDAPTVTPTPPPPIDDDPFRLAAMGVRGGAAAPAPAPDAAPDAPAPAGPPPTTRRSTILEEPRAALGTEVAGVALVFPSDGSVHTALLRQGRLRIGRGDDADLRVTDPRASADHAILRIEGERAWLLDTSSNGTWVGDERVLNDRADVTDGTLLRVGETKIVLKLLSEETLAILRSESSA